jgi:alpha-beta hydrolase superfamily lysophospholipase
MSAARRPDGPVHRRATGPHVSVGFRTRCDDPFFLMEGGHPDGVVQIAHGLGEYAARYEDLAQGSWRQVRLRG